MMRQRKPWTVQWHIGPDGTVIRQRSKGDQSHQQLYGSYATNRRVALSDLEALDERLARKQKLLGGLVVVLQGVSTVSMVGIAVGFVLALLGNDVGGLLLLVGLALLVVGFVVFGVGCGLMYVVGGDPWTDAGFESSNPVTMAAGEARAMIDAQGAVAGRQTKVTRA
ncbi:MAG: hypothetical protein ACRDO7_12215 [Nocardioidaceae bacterium]